MPARFNIAEVCVRRWARRRRSAAAPAIIEDGPGWARPRTHTFRDVAEEANRLSNALRLLGVRPGDRVAIVLPQRFETAVAYMAVWQLGAVAVPLSQLFGAEALEYRLQDSAAAVALVDDVTGAGVQAVRARCPALRHVIGLTGAFDVEVIDWPQARAGLRKRFEPHDTAADDPAVLIYTSGTTGNPKGALIPHRALIGNLSGFVCSQNWFGFDPADARVRSDAVFWSPADWTWTGGLMDALLPTLYFGRPIVAWCGRFDPLQAFALLQRHRVTHTFLFPTALKAMMKAVPEPRRHYRLHLQAIMSAGEAVGDAVFAYCRDQLGVTVNEMFGQTEINYVVGNCARLWPAKPGSMGRAYPGHRVALLDEDGHPVPVGAVGEVAVHRRDRHGDLDPVFFLGYWGNDAATRAKFTGDPSDSWCRTGDLARQDADGYLWYQGRADDVFKAAGYRIGPSEIENCLLKHPAVANAAVVPKPDPERGAVVKAFVVLTPEWAEQRARRTDPEREFDPPLVAELQAHVKGRLAPYEYPKEIEFIEALPMTTTGKVQRRVLRLQEEARARIQAAARPPANDPTER
ncbi:Acetyl-coenzyme A synthetase [Tepidimonas charontis]|uniref:Acetyl-coenzyme A synthetase n=1 Tax=Tepidimonas charontis TaxID=2267262 RepID=A0A554XF31_9BURK|nr:Acetyl-coenzyme A synthetase [Tepidimonas charontis]